MELFIIKSELSELFVTRSRMMVPTVVAELNSNNRGELSILVDPIKFLLVLTQCLKEG